MSKKQKVELLSLIDKFDGPNFVSKDELFPEIVRLALAVGIDKVDLANECTVSPSTVVRWANGTSIPGPMIQTYIVDSIRFLLEQD